MGQEYQKDHEVQRPRKFPPYFTLLIVLAIIVLSNVLSVYVFSSCGGEDAAAASPSHIRLDDGQRRMMSKIVNDTKKEMLHATNLALQKELANLKLELAALHQNTERVVQERTQTILEGLIGKRVEAGQGTDASDKPDPETNPWVNWAQGDIPAELRRYIEGRELPLGWSSNLQRSVVLSPVGHTCALLKDDLEEYMSYKPGHECPDDEHLTQRLLVSGCEPLPRRRCFARMPRDYTEPLPLPAAHWDNRPGDEKIIWTAYTCKSFECLRNRVKDKVFSDCLDCFDLEAREKHRWVVGGGGGQLDHSVDEVLSLKNGTIRIGLDLGGGTGSFAVRMKEHGVTIVTTTLNFNGPFNNFVALRGVVPMFMTISQRLPFFDNTLDIVHSMHVLSNWIPPEALEFILFDIDRILRPGGIFWLDHFFCVKPELSTLRPLLESLGYKKLMWHVGDKLDRGPELEEVYISAVLEKPMKRFSTL